MFFFSQHRTGTVQGQHNSILQTLVVKIMLHTRIKKVNDNYDSYDKQNNSNSLPFYFDMMHSFH